MWNAHALLRLCAGKFWAHSYYRSNRFCKLCGTWLKRCWRLRKWSWVIENASGADRGLSLSYIFFWPWETSASRVQLSLPCMHRLSFCENPIFNYCPIRMLGTINVLRKIRSRWCNWTGRFPRKRVNQMLLSQPKWLSSVAEFFLDMNILNCFRLQI